MKKTLILSFAAGALVLAQNQGPDQRPQAKLPMGQPTGARDGSSPTAGPELRPDAEYPLGPGDQLAIRIRDTDETGDRPVLVDTNGYIGVPLAGRIRVSGLSTVQVEAELSRRLKTYYLQPEVLVSVTEYRSQPVSVLGAVKNPGVYQVQGRKNLVEVLSLAGGPDTTAGSTVKITRRRESGAIPLANASPDPSGQYSVAEVPLASILEAQNPQSNIAIKANDVITVPPAEMVYVVGKVQKAGGFTLHEKETMTVLQALSLAGGLDSSAAPQRSRIIRTDRVTEQRTEIPVDLRGILNGRSTDLSMQPKDILFVPDSAPRRAATRAVEAALQAATGVVIWRR